MKKNVAVIFGGKSFEHDISIITTLIVLKKIDNSKYNLLPIYLSKNNEWFYYEKRTLKAELFKGFEKNYKKFGFKKVNFNLDKKTIVYKNGFKNNEVTIDAVLNCCHGGIGENGNLTALFELCDIPITTSNKTALGICMDKVLSKQYFEGLGLPIIDYLFFSKEEYETNKESVIESINKLGFPIIIKPATLGSSIGIEVVHNKQELTKALNVAFEFAHKVLIETAVLEQMKEYNIAVMRKDNKVVLSQIDTPKRTSEIFSFKDKYIGEGEGAQKNNIGKNCKVSSGKGGLLGDKKDFEKVPEKIKKEINKIAEKVYLNLELYGVVRIDFIANKKGKIFINEINTIPGSLAYYFFVPYTFKTMTEYIDCLIDESIKTEKNKSLIKQEYITNLFD